MAVMGITLLRRTKLFLATPGTPVPINPLAQFVDTLGLVSGVIQLRVYGIRLWFRTLLFRWTAGYPGTPTPIETGVAGDPYTGNPYEHPGGFPLSSGGIGVGPKGNASGTMTPRGTDATVSVGVVVSGVFDLTPPAAAKPAPHEKPKDEAKQPDRKPVEKPVQPIEQGVDQPKKKPGTGVARPDPMNEGGRPDAAGLRRAGREFTRPDWRSDHPEFGGTRMASDGRMVAVDWDLARGGGATDPVPHGDGDPRRPRKQQSRTGWRPPKPTSDDPSVFGRGAQIVAVARGVVSTKR